jgi:hypothetical protein
LGLPIDTPKRIEQGTMQRFENWIASPPKWTADDPKKVERLLAKIEATHSPRKSFDADQTGELGI